MMDPDEHEKRMDRMLWIQENPKTREYRERFHITPPPAHALPPRRQQPARKAKKIQVRAAVEKKKSRGRAPPIDPLTNKPIRHGPGAPVRPEQLLPRPDEWHPPTDGPLLVQRILGGGEVRFMDRDEFSRVRPDGRRVSWLKHMPEWSNIREHAQLSTAVLQWEKGVGGQAFVYLVQTTGPAEPRTTRDQPRQKRYYVVKEVVDHDNPAWIDDPDPLDVWMYKNSEEYRIFTECLRGVVHPNICALEAYAGLSGMDTGLLFFDYCSGGDLAGLMVEYFTRKDRIPEAFIWHVGAQLSDAVHWLHTGKENPAVAFPGGHRFSSRWRADPDRPHSAHADEPGEWRIDRSGDSTWEAIVHGDIKPANVFLKWRADDPDRLLYPDVKLGDFGWACEESHTKTLTDATYGTKAWGPPDDKVTCAMDVWALGGVIHALGTDGAAPIRDRAADVRHKEARKAGRKPSQPLYRAEPLGERELEISRVLSITDPTNSRFPGTLVSPKRYVNQDKPEWEDGNRDWTEKAASTLENPAADDYEVHTLPSCYTECLNDTVAWILNLDANKRPLMGEVAEVFATEARRRIKLQYRGLASWYVHREEEHQRSLPGFQLGGGRGRNLSVPAPEERVGKFD